MPTTPSLDRILSDVDKAFRLEECLVTTVEIGAKKTDRVVEGLRGRYPGYLFKVTKDSPGSRWARVVRWKDPTHAVAGELLQAGLNVIASAESSLRSAVSTVKKKNRKKHKK